MAKMLAVLALLSVAANAQYSPRASSAKDVTLSELSKLSPRAGPDRKTNPQGRVVTIGGRGTNPTPRALNAYGPYTQRQLVGSRGAYALTVNSGQLLSRPHLQGGRNDGGYAVTEEPQEEPLGQSPQAYQLVPQRVAIQSPVNQPRTVHQFQYPVQQQFQNPQLEQPLFVPYSPQQPQQYLRETQAVPSPPVSPNAPVNFPQAQGQPQPSYTLQQQFYEQDPQIQYVQSNPSIPVTTPSPVSQVSLPPVNSHNFQLSALPITGVTSSPSIQNQLAGHGNEYGVSPSAYTGSQQHYTIPVSSINAVKPLQEVHYTTQSPLRSFFHRQLHPQSTTARPLIPAARAIQIGYQQQHIPQERDKDILSQGIYNSYNQPIGNIDSQQQLKVLAYSQQQPIAGSYAPDSTYGLQNSLNRNPIEYASPFARQELIESRERGTAEGGQLSSQLQFVRRLNEDGDYDSLSKSDERKKVNSFGSGYPIDFYG